MLSFNAELVSVEGARNCGGLEEMCVTTDASSELLREELHQKAGQRGATRQVEHAPRVSQRAACTATTTAGGRMTGAIATMTVAIATTTTGAATTGTATVTTARAIETATTRTAARRTAEHVSVNARASVRARETATATACLNAAALL